MAYTHLIQLAGCISLPYIGSSFGVGVVCRNRNWEASLKHPKCYPPTRLYCPIWSMMYGSMGVASYFVLREAEGGADVSLPLAVYGGHLLLNWSWTTVYYGMKKLRLSAAVTLGTTAGAAASAILFGRVSRTAGYIMIPYVLWMLFASYLNIGVACLNPEPSSSPNKLN